MKHLNLVFFLIESSLPIIRIAALIFFLLFSFCKIMNFENKLISGLFIKRYKRFFVDVKLKNKIVTAHCPNQDQ